MVNDQLSKVNVNRHISAHMYGARSSVRQVSCLGHIINESSLMITRLLHMISW
jgi:hypothetical protein